MRIRIVTFMLALTLGVTAACNSGDGSTTDRDPTQPGGANNTASGGTSKTPATPSGSTGKGEPPPPPPTPPKVEVTNETLNVNGIERSYVLVFPKTPDSL